MPLARREPAHSPALDTRTSTRLFTTLLSHHITHHTLKPTTTPPACPYRHPRTSSTRPCAHTTHAHAHALAALVTARGSFVRTHRSHTTHTLICITHTHHKVTAASSARRHPGAWHPESRPRGRYAMLVPSLRYATPHCLRTATAMPTNVFLNTTTSAVPKPVTFTQSMHTCQNRSSFKITIHRLTFLSCNRTIRPSKLHPEIFQWM